MNKSKVDTQSKVTLLPSKDAEYIRGKLVSSTAPTDGDALRYDGTTWDLGTIGEIRVPMMDYGTEA